MQCANQGTFAPSVPGPGASCATRVASLSALQEMTVRNPLGEDSDRSRLRIPIPVEPAFMAVSEAYTVVGLNNQAWFYAVTDSDNPNEGVCVHACACVYVSVSVYECVYLCMCVCVYVYICTYACV